MNLTRYSIMWVMVMPKLQKCELKNAVAFRRFLSTGGFEKKQNSVYMKFAADRETAHEIGRSILDQTPPGGQISILFFTDRQMQESMSHP